MQKMNINIALPLINSADFGFIPDEANNRIIYSLKAINGIGDEVVHLLLQNRIYKTTQEFYEKMIETKLIKTGQMIKLIKAGAFTELDSEDRKQTMEYFLRNYVVEPINKITFQQFPRLISFDESYKLIPKDYSLAIRHKYFQDYVLNEAFLYKEYIDPNSKRKLPKCGYNDRWFKLDYESMSFFIQYYTEDSVVEVVDEYYVVSEKKFKKESNKYIEGFVEWMKTEDAVNAYNDCLFKEKWDKYATGSISKWEMESLSIYKDTHELAHMNNELYGVVDYFDLSTEPEVYDHYYRTVSQVVDGTTVKVKKEFPKYKIIRLAGTVLDKNKDKHMISLLTTTGVVTLKFNKGQFLYYDKQISQITEEGKKERVESSWFARGNKIMVCGYKNDNQFRVYKYADTVWKHTCSLITDIYDDGTISVKTERERIED